MTSFPCAQPELIAIRPLTPDDAGVYRALRQRILASGDGRFFSDSYERERRLTENQWLEWCTETPEHCILGTFAGRELVGVIMITRYGGQNSPVVEWEAAWLDPRYREAGIGRLAYDRARQWSQEQGYRFVAGFIRATYTPARKICHDLGFVHAYSIRGELWADGSVADVDAYLLDLRPERARYALRPLVERFSEALPFLSMGIHAPPLADCVRVA